MYQFKLIFKFIDEQTHKVIYQQEIKNMNIYEQQEGQVLFSGCKKIDKRKSY